MPKFGLWKTPQASFCVLFDNSLNSIPVFRYHKILQAQFLLVLFLWDTDSSLQGFLRNQDPTLRVLTATLKSDRNGTIKKKWNYTKVSNSNSILLFKNLMFTFVFLFSYWKAWFQIVSTCLLICFNLLIA